MPMPIQAHTLTTDLSMESDRTHIDEAVAAPQAAKVQCFFVVANYPLDPLSSDLASSPIHPHFFHLPNCSNELIGLLYLLTHC